MIAVAHNEFLVVAAIAVSLVAAFTGLVITNHMTGLPEGKRQARVVMSAFILGGGIWSMHFVAMLAHEMSVPVYYDSLRTLGSALIAILVSGAALLMLHFSVRTSRRLTVAGLIFGLGIVAMHYVGMLAIRGVTPAFSTASVIVALLVALATGIGAMRVAYGNANRQNIIYGAAFLGLAVVAVHYAAMFGTSFTVQENFQPVSVALANDMLAISVTVAAFVICGTFLLAATTFLTQDIPDAALQNDGVPEEDFDSLPSPFDAHETVDPVGAESVPEPVDDSVVPAGASGNAPKDSPIDPSMPGDTEPVRIPFEKDKRIDYLDPATVGAVRADGHYTHMYTRDGVLFCPWSITEAEKRLAPYQFHRAHRSYLVNIAAVEAFEKRRETGVCVFRGFPQLSTVPVSRNRVNEFASVLTSAAG